MAFIIKVGEEQILEMSHYSVQKVNIPFTFQPAKHQYTQNNSAGFTYGCEQ